MLDKYSSVPATRRAVNGLLKENALLKMGTTALANIVDNSTGDSANGYQAITTQRSTFTHADGSDLADKATFDAALDKINDAVAVLKGAINQIAAPIESTAVTGGDGAVAVAGTVPALDKAVTGTDGATALAVSRAGGNAALKVVRDNLSTLILNYNRIADRFQQNRIMDAGEGAAGTTLSNGPDSGEAVTAADDCMSKAFADGALTLIADNVAYLADRVGDLQDWLVSESEVTVA